jgi:hypothetical protein
MPPSLQAEAGMMHCDRDRPLLSSWHFPDACVSDIAPMPAAGRFRDPATKHFLNFYAQLHYKGRSNGPQSGLKPSFE